VRDGDDWVINGTKHFISHADVADFAILFAATGEEDTPRGREEAHHRLPRRQGHARLHGAPGYNVGRTAAITTASSPSTTAAVPVPRCWARCTRASTSPTPGSAPPACRSPPPASAGPNGRSSHLPLAWAAERRQFGQQIGKFQGVSFKLADMAMELKAAELLTLEAAWKCDQGP
jgi:acyl-CoA dehydrogenase